jgi:predicted esterase
MPYKLIFTIHTLGGSAEQITNGGMGPPAYYGLPPLSNNTAIFISPNGQLAGSVGGFTGWGNTGGEDVDFIDAIIETVEKELCIDQEKRFSTGFSYGGAMSFALACALPDKFKAVGIM